MNKPKPSWQRVKFAQLADCVNDRVADPATAGVERYVGLEHLDSDSLVIRRWGTPDEVESTKLRFRPGDIIFGKRRAYQRKLAVADFEGICSAHAMVLRPKPGAVLPKLLPFFMQSDAFMDRAKAISVGSLSPTINWKTLAAEEFLLPPTSEQNRICHLLSLLESTQQTMKQMAAALSGSLDALAQWYATAGLQKLDSTGVVESDCLPRGWQLKPIRSICTGSGAGLTLGPFGSALKVDDYGHLSEGTPVLFVADVGRFDLQHHSKRFISPSKHAELAAHEAIAGDVLVTEMGWPPGEACVVPIGWPPSIIKADIIRARVNRSTMSPEYLELILNSHWGQQQLVRISPGTTRPRMTLRDFEELVLAVPPVDEQQRAVEQTAEVQARAADTRRRLDAIDDLRRAALASALGDS